MARSKTKVSERTKKSEGENPIGIVAGFRQVVQDLLVPELKAIQVTLQHHGELIQGLQRQMETMQKQNVEEFTKVWKAITELLEAQQHNQVILQRILDRLDVTEMVRETQTRQKVIEAQTEQLREEVAHLRRLLEMAMQQRGIQPTTQ
jgi:translation initiation factor 2B subunit (eIF-2B alpha/beta/delta family)